MLAAHCFIDEECWGVKLVYRAHSLVANAKVNVGRRHCLGDETEVFARHLCWHVICVISNKPAMLNSSWTPEQSGSTHTIKPMWSEPHLVATCFANAYIAASLTVAG